MCEEKINRILVKIFDLDERTSEKNLTRDEVYRWDSLTHMDLVTTIERECKITLTLDDIIEMSSFSGIREVVCSKNDEDGE